MKEVDVTIQFNLAEIAISDLFNIETLLDKAGITFDTGAGMGFRDWSWDYCLEGPIKVFAKDEKDPENSVIIQFDFLNKPKMSKIIEVERALKDLGITFHIEMNNNYRYWHLNDLKGPMEIFFKNFKDDKNE
jgi:hypothetical protein